jgi:chromosome segregation ATPase
MGFTISMPARISPFVSAGCQSKTHSAAEQLLSRQLSQIKTDVGGLKMVIESGLVELKGLIEARAMLKAVEEIRTQAQAAFDLLRRHVNEGIDRVAAKASEGQKASEVELAACKTSVAALSLGLAELSEQTGSSSKSLTVKIAELSEQHRQVASQLAQVLQDIVRTRIDVQVAQEPLQVRLAAVESQLNSLGDAAAQDQDALGALSARLEHLSTQLDTTRDVVAELGVRFAEMKDEFTAHLVAHGRRWWKGTLPRAWTAVRGLVHRIRGIQSRQSTPS